MYQYARPSITPRTGYVYTDPDTGVRFEESLHRTLVDTVARHRRANKLAVPPNLSDIIEDAICRMNPASFRTDRPVVAGSPASPPHPQQRGAVSLSAATAATLRVLRARTSPLVDSTVVRERAAICRACAENLREPCCYSCKVESVFSPIVGAKHRNLSTAMLGVCGADNTFTKAVVWVSGSRAFISVYPGACWKTTKEIEDGDGQNRSGDHD